MNATTQFTITPEEVEASDRFHYEAETQTLNDIFFSKYRVAEDDNGETIFLKKYEKSPLTPAEDTFILDTIKEELIPEYVLPEKKKEFYLPKFAMGLIKEYMDIRPEYRRNKEAEMIKKWWRVDDENSVEGDWYGLYMGSESFNGGADPNWFKDDADRTPWSMLQIRLAVCNEGNLRQGSGVFGEMKFLLWCYKANEKQFNEEKREGISSYNRDVNWRVEKSKMMRNIRWLMDETLTALKNKCRAQGIKGHSGKKKWALVTHMIEYGTDFDIYGEFDYPITNGTDGNQVRASGKNGKDKTTWGKLHPEMVYTLWLNNTRVMKP